MNIVKKMVGVSALALASMSANAGVISVGGISWDPSSVIDFSSGFTFNQFYSSVGSTGEEITAAQFANQVAPASAAALNGAELVGTGSFFEINENGNTGVMPYIGPFCTGGTNTCELTFSFGGLIFQDTGGLGTFDTSNSWLNIYVDYTPDFNGTTGTSDYADAQNGSLWLSLGFDAFAINFGGLGVGGGSEGFLSVDTVDDGGGDKFGGAAENNFDTDSIMPSGADFILNASVLRQLPDGTFRGNGNAIGESIPEPTSIVIFGLGLLGLAGAARRKKS